MRVASQLHDNWRAARRLADGTYEPRPKIVGGHTFDIANLSYQELPEQYKNENILAACVL